MSQQQCDFELAKMVVDFLNELVEIDRVAIAALIANRVPCNAELADHPSVQVKSQHGGYHVGLLGILNGLCGVNEVGDGVIVADFSLYEDGKYADLLGFHVAGVNAADKAQEASTG